MLFLNATDLDRSREYGQESIIYSLEGSSQFRINARSGEHPPPMPRGPRHLHLRPAPHAQPWSCSWAKFSLPFTGSPRVEHASFKRLVLSLKY